MAEAAKRLPGVPHRSTVYRWWKRGRNGKRLRVVKVGRMPCTTEAWLMEFFESTDNPMTPTTPRRRRRQRHQAAAQARKLLGLDD